MKIEVKKYMLSYEGKIYTTGDIIEVKDKSVARRLIAQSKGNLDFYRGQDFSKSVEETVESEEETVELPEIDPSAAIDNRKKGKK